MPSYGGGSPWGGNGGSMGNPGGTPSGGNGGFCDQHQTTCAVGRWVGGLFGGGEKPKRSRCGTVSPGATPAPWMRGVSRGVLGRAFGMSDQEVNAQFTQGEQDEFYVGVVVPYCRAIEGQPFDQHPDSAEANAWRNAIYDQLVADLKSGRVPIEFHPPGGGSTGGTDPIGQPGGGSNSGPGGRGSAGSNCPPGTFDFLGVCWGGNAAGRGGTGAGSPRPGTPAGPGGGALAGVSPWLALALAGGLIFMLVRGRS